MAYVQYDFYHPWDKKKEHRIIGSIPVKSLSVANKITEILNLEHGQGSHWAVEEGVYPWNKHPQNFGRIRWSAFILATPSGAHRHRCSATNDDW